MRRCSAVLNRCLWLHDQSRDGSCALLVLHACGAMGGAVMMLTAWCGSSHVPRRRQRAYSALTPVCRLSKLLLVCCKAANP